MQPDWCRDEENIPAKCRNNRKTSPRPENSCFAHCKLFLGIILKGLRGSLKVAFCMFFFHRTILDGRGEFLLAWVFKWWDFFCNFVNSFCWSSLVSRWRLPDHNAVEAQNCFCHQLHFVVPVGTKSKIRNQNNKKYIDDISAAIFLSSIGPCSSHRH